MTHAMLARRAETGAREDGDRLEWVARRFISAYGVRVGLRSTDRAALETLLTEIPEIWTPCSGPGIEPLYSLRVDPSDVGAEARPFHELSEDERLVTRSPDLSRVRETFQRRLKMYLAEMAPGHTFVHAGAVGWHGKAIVVPGPSESGKTSLVTALVRAGATYYSDEYAVLDERGRVHPYPAPPALRQAGSRLQTTCRVEELGGRIGTRPLPVGLIVVTRYRPGARWRPRRLSAGRAVLELLANTVPARRKPAAAIAMLQQAVTGVVTLKGARGDATETAASVLDRLGGRRD
jgi:hypothetical protein